jgi:hypothetical protein
VIARTIGLVGVSAFVCLGAGCHSHSPASQCPRWFVRVPAEPLPASDWVELEDFSWYDRTGNFSIDVLIPYEWAAVLVLVASDGRRVPVFHVSTQDLVTDYPLSFRRDFDFRANVRELGIDGPFRVELHAYVPNEHAPDLPQDNLDAEQLAAALERIAELPRSRRRIAVGGFLLPETP